MLTEDMGVAWKEIPRGIHLFKKDVAAVGTWGNFFPSSQGSKKGNFFAFKEQQLFLLYI